MMKTLRGLIVAALALIAAPALAQQSAPNWSQGYVPTAAEWNFWFGKKSDWPGSNGCLLSGCTMTGPIITVAVSATSAGLNLPPGTAPSSPNNGDIWSTASGFFIRYGGATYQLGTGGGTGIGVAGNIAYYTGPSTIVGNPNLNISSGVVTAGLAGSVVGNYCLANATSGSICIAPPTGALGASIATISTGTYNIVGDSLTQTLSNKSFSTAVSITSNSGQSLAVGPNGTTNPVLRVDSSIASQITGIGVRGQASGGGANLFVNSSSANESLFLNAKGTSSVIIGNVSTGGFGFNLGSDATGDTYYRNSGGTLTRVAVGSNAQVWTISAGVPSWQAAAPTSITVGTTNIASGASGNIEFNNAGVLGEVTPNGGNRIVSGNLQNDPAYTGFANSGCTISWTTSTNNVSVQLLNSAGAAPTTAAPCYINTRSTTLTSGAVSAVAVTAATSFSANAGSTFGITNTSATCRAAASCPFKLWAVALNNGGTIVLGVVALTNASGVDPLNEGTLLSTTACNACATATTIGTVYTTVAQTSLGWKYIGYGEWGSGLATAGTYATGPTAVQNMGVGIHKPGEVVQTQLCCVGNVTVVTTAGTTFGAGVTTNVTATIVPTMASNLVRFSYALTSGSAGAGNTQICQNSITGPTAIGMISKGQTTNASGVITNVFSGYDTPGSTASITYFARCWVSGSTGSFPAVNTDSAFEELSEIMG